MSLINISSKTVDQSEDPEAWASIASFCLQEQVVIVTFVFDGHLATVGILCCPLKKHSWALRLTDLDTKMCSVWMASKNLE